MDFTYTTVLHSVRKRFKLSMIEYCIADSIHKLSSNPAARDGWCTASREYLAEFIGCSRRSVFTAIDRLELIGFIEKDSKGRLRSTGLWYEMVVVQKLHPQSANSAPSSANSAPNNNSHNNSDNIHPSDECAPVGAPAMGGVRSNPPSFGTVLNRPLRGGRKKWSKAEINLVVDYFHTKLELKMLDGSVPKNRQYASTMLKKFGGVREVKAIIDATAASSFWKPKVTSFEILFNKAVRIMSENRDNSARGEVIVVA